VPEVRDRDDAGRARQLRPRDALGRPLPYGSVGVTQIPDMVGSPLETVELARRLIDEGRAFSAHEVLESQWKRGPVEERDLWQGLAQLCVAITHAGRGNSVGAARVLQRAQDVLARYQDSDGPTYGVDLTRAWERARDSVAVQGASCIAPLSAAAGDALVGVDAAASQTTGGGDPVRTSGSADEERWDGEGGHAAPHIRRSRLIDELAGASEAQRAELWDAAVREFGEDGASRIWQEGLSSSDASDT
jgi:uncharacterized protein